MFVLFIFFYLVIGVGFSFSMISDRNKKLPRFKALLSFKLGVVLMIVWPVVVTICLIKTLFGWLDELDI